MPKRNARLCASICVVAFISATCLILVVLTVGLEYWESQALKRLAGDLEIGASWEDFEEYLVQTIVPGMTREKMWIEAHKIGPFVVKPSVYRELDWRWGPHADPVYRIRGEMIAFDFDALGFPPFGENRKYTHFWVYWDAEGFVEDISWGFAPS
jgi:hypothetical protein